MRAAPPRGRVTGVQTRWRAAMRGLPLCVLALAAFPAHAVSTFTVTEPWVRVAANGRSAEAFMQLKSSDGETVVGVRSEDVGNVTMLDNGRKRTPVTRIA